MSRIIVNILAWIGAFYLTAVFLSICNQLSQRRKIRQARTDAIVKLKKLIKDTQEEWKRRQSHKPIKPVISNKPLKPKPISESERLDKILDDWETEHRKDNKG